jgi:phosphoglycolate phosphatase
MKNISAILFDLDGTLLDTWSDILHSLRIIEYKYKGYYSDKCNEARDQVSIGTEAMLKIIFNTESINSTLIAEAEKIYMELPNKEQKTQLFDGVEKTINNLNLKQIPWGIVTNKPKILTHNLFKTLPELKPPSKCIVCPEDANGKKKPSPEPILEACRILSLAPSECLFVGDSVNDIIAGKLAGTATVAALFGYIPRNQNPELDWNANFYIKKFDDINNLLAKLKIITQ